MQILVTLVMFAAGLALAFAAFNFFGVKRMPEGTEKMSEIAAAIRVGANAFISYEYRILYLVVAIVAVLMAIVTTWHAAVALVIGAVMSGCAGFVGMKIATYANVRVSNTARESGSIGKTVKVAFRGGSVMGLCVGGFALLGLFLVYVIFGIAMDQISVTGASYVNLLGMKFIPFTMTLSGYALGCSIVAMFNRVGGGIYTKAADMGADLVGKTEAHIPEDDPRNPATIADNVGDNVGDVAGLGSDLLESFVGGLLVGSTLASIMMAIFCGNVGGAWDNGKKFIEVGGVEGHGKGSETHEAAVVGDTVGDPLKDTVGPCLDIFIKIMSTVSLVAVPVFAQFNVVDLIAKIFGQ